MFSLFFIFIISFSFNTMANDLTPCTVLLEGVAIQSAKIEIAELLLEHAKLSGGTSAPLRSLLQKNIKQKIKEFKNNFGIELNSAEIKNLIVKIEEGSLKKIKNSTEKEQNIRERESKSLAITKEYFSEDMGKFHQLDDTYFENIQGMKNNNITGGGVQWSTDEKYVVFRGSEEKPRIYNTEEKRFLDYRPTTGIVSGEGHLYAENDRDQTLIRDLDTGDQWGPFSGNPIHRRDLFNNKFIIMTNDMISPITSLKDTFYTLVDFKNNRQIELGNDFAISLDHKLIVRKKGNTKIEVVEVATSNLVKNFNVEEKEMRLVASPKGSFIFKRSSKIYFVRLSDLKVFELPSEDEPYRMSADGTKLIFKNSSRRRKKDVIAIYDLNTSKLTRFNGLGEFTLSPDGMHVLIHGYQTTKTILVDLASMVTRNLPGDFERWSPNSRWVYNSIPGGQWSHSLFDLETAKKFSFKAGFDFNFIGKTNYALTESHDSEKAFINDMTQWMGNPFSLQIGDTEAKPSPSGKFIVTYKGKKVSLSEFGEP